MKWIGLVLIGTAICCMAFVSSVWGFKEDEDVCPPGFCQNWGICKEDDNVEPYCECYAFFDFPKNETCQEHVVTPAGLAGKLVMVIANSVIQGLVAVLGICCLIQKRRKQRLRMDVPNLYVASLTVSSLGFCVLYAINFGNVWALYPPWVQALLYVPFTMIDLGGEAVFIFFWMYMILNFFRKQSLAEMTRTSSMHYVLKTWVLPCVLLTWSVGITILLQVWAMAISLTVATYSVATVVQILSFQLVVFPALLIWTRVKVNQMAERTAPEVAEVLHRKYSWFVPVNFVALMAYSMFLILNISGVSTMSPGWGYVAYRTSENAFYCAYRAFLMWGLSSGGRHGARIKSFLGGGTSRFTTKPSASRRSNGSARSHTDSSASSPPLEFKSSSKDREDL